MSSPPVRRADRSMSEERALELLARGYSGRLATVSEDGFPYLITAALSAILVWPIAACACSVGYELSRRGTSSSGSAKP
jgi:hypothetical protein